MSVSMPTCTPPQYIILRSVFAGGKSVKQIRTAIENAGAEITPPNVSQMINRMVKAGWIEKPRAGFCEMTNAGRAEFSRVKTFYK